MDNRINLLPSPTWNRLGVNSAGERAELPPVPEEGWGAADVIIKSVPDGVVIDEDTPLACEELRSGLGEYADAIIAGNANASWSITAEGVVSEPVIIESAVSEGVANVICGSVYAVEGAELTVLTVVRGDAGISENLIRVYAEKCAKVRIIEVQLLTGGASHWSGLAAFEEEGASVELTRVELGGDISVCGSKAVLSGKGAGYDMALSYFGAGNAVLDFNDIAEHLGRETLTEMHAAGALTDSADKIQRGTIDFLRGAKRAIGHESEDVILLSPNVRNRTVPVILCGEEEVEGQHAASAGRLDEAALYYLNTRGISPEEARKMMVEARFAPSLDRIPDEEAREEARRELGRRLGAI